VGSCSSSVSTQRSPINNRFADWFAPRRDANGSSTLRAMRRAGSSASRIYPAIPTRGDLEPGDWVASL